MLLNALFHVHAARVQRPDFTLYQVLAYLIVWRADDLGAALRDVAASPSSPAVLAYAQRLGIPPDAIQMGAAAFVAVLSGD